MDPSLIEAAITHRTKAIMPVHLFGQVCDMDPIMAIASQHGLHVIEDAAQSITATYKGRKAGSIGSCGCFSFFPSKNLGAAGDGGMIVTNDESLYQRIFLMRNHGARPKYFHKFVGGNFRLDPIQAAVLLAKLPHLADWTEARRQNATYYNEQFSGTAVSTPIVRHDCESIYNQYVIRLQNRDGLIDHLRACNIGCEIYYPLPLHEQECFASLGYKPSDCPLASAASREVVAIPVYPELTGGDREYVVQSILTYFC
jgi:dTDP-4-amino-4,6-dideoxygalactose transaminase